MIDPIHLTKRLGSAVKMFLIGWLLIAGMVGYTFLLGARQVYRRAVRFGGTVAAAVPPDWAVTPR